MKPIIILGTVLLIIDAMASTLSWAQFTAALLTAIGVLFTFSVSKANRKTQ